jgi:DNA-directed RNA polymerase specialized sigma24 family protein
LETRERAEDPVQRKVVDALYRAFFVRLVRRVTWKYGLSKEDASEIVHDAFLLALGRLDPSRNPRAWIYAVVDRLSANWKRKVYRRALLLAQWQPSPNRSSVDELEDILEGLD